jgi:hypothetical protein
MELIYQKMHKVAEDFFGTNDDPDQISITEESNRKLRSIDNDTIMYKVDRNGDPISWIIVIPTSREVMNKFLNKEITERELLEITVEEKSFEALYLCSAFTLPKYRKQGLAKELTLEAVKKFAPNVENELYSYPFSEEGKSALKSLEKELGREIKFRKD